MCARAGPQTMEPRSRAMEVRSPSPFMSWSSEGLLSPAEW